jgi:hypothetical protein
MHMHMHVGFYYRPACETPIIVDESDAEFPKVTCPIETCQYEFCYHCYNTVCCYSSHWHHVRHSVTLPHSIIVIGSFVACLLDWLAYCLAVWLVP